MEGSEEGVIEGVEVVGRRVGMAEVGELVGV